MSSLKDLDIFEIHPIIQNFCCKLSTISEYDIHKQILCLVSDNDDLLLRYTHDKGTSVLKLISWFRINNRLIHDVSFDPAGIWLLVLCSDNTLHIVPALAIVDKAWTVAYLKKSQHQMSYSISSITSYIIPFVGPHECPDSKKCPNNMSRQQSTQFTAQDTSFSLGNENRFEQNKEEFNAEQSFAETQVQNNFELFDIETNNLHKCDLNFQQEGQHHIMNRYSPFMVSTTCPYPLSVIWWKTWEGVNRAIIGYSDGSLCFVGLSPNCPFVASTNISKGSIVKLVICRDKIYENAILLITSSNNEQYKLLLDQAKIRYVYPGDSSFMTTMNPESDDWQIVMPLKNTNINNTETKDNSAISFDGEDNLGIVTFIGACGGVLSKDLSSKKENPPLNSKNKLNWQIDLKTTKCITTCISAPQMKARLNGNENQESLPQIPKVQLSPDSPPGYNVTIRRFSTVSNSTIVIKPYKVDDYYLSCSPTSKMDIAPDLLQHIWLNSNEPNDKSGILPTARARLASLKSLGTRKLNALKLRLSDGRQKELVDYIPDIDYQADFDIIASPSSTPELIHKSVDSLYTIQNLRNTYLLSSLHNQSNSLSVHSIDINAVPLFIYKIPVKCIDILICSNILYSIQNGETIDDELTSNTNNIKEKDQKESENINILDSNNTYLLKENETNSTNQHGFSTNNKIYEQKYTNKVGVISSAMASIRQEDNNMKTKSDSLLSSFDLKNETILNLYQMTTYRSNIDIQTTKEQITIEEKKKAFSNKTNNPYSAINYVNFYDDIVSHKEMSLRQMEIMRNEFPKINYDPCYVITNRNVYYIQLKKEPYAIFLDAALAGEWQQCREFCNTFDLNYESCIEFAGDYLLRQRKVTQALITYNSAKIKPIRTALKLAMYGQTVALMHLCAMALKITYILNSKYLTHPIIRSLLPDITYRHSEDVRDKLYVEAGNNPVTDDSNQTDQQANTVLLDANNCGISCSDFVYKPENSTSGHNASQISPSSQFHLANLLLISLAEITVTEKNYIPLWNFIATNNKYHSNMTSIVLCQSGLYSSALLLAKVRGVCLDTFLALTSVMGQEFGWYSEMNACLYNLSENIFMETLTYLPKVASDYFEFIHEKINYIRPVVLKRLEEQLNPFSAVLRPIVSHVSTEHTLHNSNENDQYLYDFCRHLIETYLNILMHLDRQNNRTDCILNALSSFRLMYEDQQFAIDSTRFKPISASCGNCACIVNGVAYFWGTNGIPCYYNANKLQEQVEPSYAVKSLDLLSNINLIVHAVKCGRNHTLILTNNGLYSFGNNTFGQLGIGHHMKMSQQPMLVKVLDNKNITILEAGQYHNAAVADGVLYTWGWGIYGQLGNGYVDNIMEPQPVPFFKNKKILQVSLGHAHSLVLCQFANSSINELYAFGSNHFGQLGLGKNTAIGDTNIKTQGSFCQINGGNGGPVKYCLPQRVIINSLSTSIRLIHTKFFTNLAVDETECLYTWGSSPQALRLANQMKRRANTKNKIEDLQRREITKQLDTTGIFFEAKSRSAGNNNVGSVLQRYLNNRAKERLSPTILQPQTLYPPKSPTKSIAEKATDDSCATNQLKSHLSDSDLPNARDPAVTLTNAVPENDPMEYLTPHSIDISEVAGKILQLSSGLFHFALISSSCTLYTWGKNMEHQLGIDDKDRRAVNKPMAVDSIEQPMYVDCGSDFTLVMTTDYVVKAFGGNFNGQCGRDMGAPIDRAKNRIICLPATKRLMRFEGQCIEVPVEINLPRPRIRLDTEPFRYLKSLPIYQPYFLQEPDISLNNSSDSNSCSEEYSHPDNGQEQISSSINASALSQKENGNSLQESSVTTAEQCLLQENNRNKKEKCTERFNILLTNSEDQSTGEMNTSKEVTEETESVDEKVANILPFLEDKERQPETNENEIQMQQQLRHYIHYCLYIFHGLYEPLRIREFAKNQPEYYIRVLMLNYRFVDAFVLCLQEVHSSMNAIRLFEYFAKDTGCVPLRKSELRLLIYNLFNHFIKCNYDLTECERFFLTDLDYYLLELAYVLYFNNNNNNANNNSNNSNLLEHSLNEKFKHLIDLEESGNDSDRTSNTILREKTGNGLSLFSNATNNSVYKMENTDVIFDQLSVKFKTIVCQYLLKYNITIN